MAREQMTGSEIILKALVDQGVDVVFGYPGGAVLPIYDTLFKQNSVRHVLARQEGGAVHAAEGYARSTGKVGVVLVTSGPGATNAVTGLTDALMDSIPVVCITGQVATHMIGNDAFQEADTVGITRPCTKHNYLVKDINDLARVMHEAFYVARSGRPGPVVVDIPKDIQIVAGPYVSPGSVSHRSYHPQVKGDLTAIRKAVKMIAAAKRPVFYTGGGVINSGPGASQLLTELVRMTGYPITSTLMGLGAYPASDKQFLGMMGMHGTYEANLAMANCDLMIAVGARFDDRVTGRLDAFSQGSKKIQIDIDPSSINKNVRVDLPVIGDVAHVLEDLIKIWKSEVARPDADALAKWWSKVEAWRGRECLRYAPSAEFIKPQFALQRLNEKTKGRDVYFTTDVGQHQMWTAQFIGFDEPNRWMTSGGLGTMGYGLPAALGVQMAHPDALVVCVSGDASLLMNIQEMSTLAQYRLPVKIVLLNNGKMGMVRQWQDLLHGGRYSESYMDSMPDFARLAEAFGAVGLRATMPDEVDGVIDEMLKVDKPVLLDMVISDENCLPMVPSGAPHYEMILGDDEEGESTAEVTDEGLALV